MSQLSFHACLNAMLGFLFPLEFLDNSLNRSCNNDLHLSCTGHMFVYLKILVLNVISAI